MISKYVTWDVGRGDEALFWEDSQDEQPPLINLNILDNAINVLSNLWGSKVSDYKTLKKIDGEDKWVWKTLENVNITLEEKVHFEEALKN